MGSQRVWRGRMGKVERLKFKDSVDSRRPLGSPGRCVVVDDEDIKIGSSKSPGV